jgi:hypothetical protein
MRCAPGRLRGPIGGLAPRARAHLGTGVQYHPSATPNRFAARDRKSKPGARVEGRKTRAERLAKQKHVFLVALITGVTVLIGSSFATQAAPSLSAKG